MYENSTSGGGAKFQVILEKKEKLRLETTGKSWYRTRLLLSRVPLVCTDHRITRAEQVEIK
jgi:hypothetical protein